MPVSADLLKKIQPGGAIEYYTCPMPEHANVHEGKPGKCPLCGMTLIPVMAKPSPRETSLQSSPQKETPLPTLYTCPMAAHADVVSDKPGFCPKCEMELVPTSTVPHGKIAEDHWRKEHQP